MVKIRYPLPVNAPTNELSIEVENDLLQFLIDGNAVTLASDGVYEFNGRGINQIKKAD